MGCERKGLVFFTFMLVSSTIMCVCLLKEMLSSWCHLAHVGSLLVVVQMYCVFFANGTH